MNILEQILAIANDGQATDRLGDIVKLAREYLDSDNMPSFPEAGERLWIVPGTRPPNNPRAIRLSRQGASTMTTQAAANLYLAQHHMEWQGAKHAIFNPHDKPEHMLPVIYGFNNGGSPGWYSACLLAEDGTGLGGHICSHEGYMRHDLGILEGSRPDRHEHFKAHYPDGYRMAFIPSDEVRTHPGLEAAYQKNQQRAAEAKTVGEAAEQNL